MIIQRLKSKTNVTAAIIAALGIMQTNFPQIQAQLGEYAGFTYIGIGMLMVVLRELTVKPITEK